jgi:hypothetical protein
METELHFPTKREHTGNCPAGRLATALQRSNVGGSQAGACPKRCLCQICRNFPAAARRVRFYSIFRIRALPLYPPNGQSTSHPKIHLAVEKAIHLCGKKAGLKSATQLPRGQEGTPPRRTPLAVNFMAGGASRWWTRVYIVGLWYAKTRPEMSHSSLGCE